MVAEHNMTLARTQTEIKPTKAAILAVREADNPVNNVKPVHTTPR